MQKASLEIAEGPGARDSAAPDSRTLHVALFACVAYYLGTKVGFALTFQPHPISTLWPPNAILLAALLLTPTRSWWVPILAVLPAHVAGELQSGVPATMVLGWFASNCSEALIGAGTVRYLVKGEALRFDSFRHVGAFVAGAAFLGPFLSSFIDAGVVRWVGFGGTGYWDMWRTRFFSNMLAELTIVPVIVCWAHGGLESLRNRSGALHVEAGLVALGLIGSAAFAFGTHDAALNASPALLYAPLPFLIWAAVRLGPRGTSLALVVVVFLAVWGAIHGQGPFVRGSPADSALAVQLFLAVLAVPVLMLAAVLREREQAILEHARMEREAHEQRARLTHLARVAILGELTAALSHELNQPLAAILANAETSQRLLDEPTVDLGELRGALRDIVADDQRAAEVIGRLRSLLKRGETRSQPIDLNVLVLEAIGLARGDLARRGIVTGMQLADGLGPVRGDPVQLQQVILNVVLNACDEMAANAPGSRRLDIATEQDASGKIRLSIADSGPGIDPDRLESLFEPFVTTKPDGLGLGLSISRAIVTAHGGHIRAENRPEGGATLILELPAPVRLAGSPGGA